MIQHNVKVNLKTQIWRIVVMVVVAMVMEAMSLNGPNVCMVKQKYNITKRIKYRAPMTVRTYEWCFSMPPKCSKYKTEMRDLTRLETEERTAEVAVCCPGFKMEDVSCVAICPNGKTGSGCSEECPSNKWGPNCVNDCKSCSGHGSCSPLTGECVCQDGWQGESCTISMPTTTTTTTTTVEELLTTKLPTETTIPSTTPITATTRASLIETTTTSIISSSTIKTVTTTPKIAISTPISTITNIINTSPLFVATQNDIDETTPVTASIESEKETTMYSVMSTTLDDTETFERTTAETTGRIITSNYNRTEIPSKSTISTTELPIDIKTGPTTNVTTKLSNVMIITEPSKSIISLKSTKEILKEETTKKPEVTLKLFPTTLKFKPKEIWIKPAQKGESQFVESKVKATYEMAHPRYRSATNKEFSPNTTPKTIIVSIIPTSVSYATFKKIALTTGLFSSQKTNATTTSYNQSSEQGFTKPMSVPTFTLSPFTAILNRSSSSRSPIPTLAHTTKHLPSTSVTARISNLIKTKVTNSTIATTVTTKLNYFNHLTSTVSSTNDQIYIQDISEKTRTASNISNTTNIEKVTKFINHFVKTTDNNVTILTEKVTTTPVKIMKTIVTDIANTNKVTTVDPTDEEDFHILTEPEHITAVMGEKGKERSSVDLVSVISIAGGVMMSVITVAVIIVMIERCKRHSYEDVRKINDIRMQVMIDDIPPPPYVRSIFHTPLPDPPTAEKCHYQPISTLDRNLKQFMRPVVVQNISPIMLENFRGILECHYDHLPRRSHDFETMHPRCSIAPSMDNVDEIHHIRACNVTESTIEAMKCEARLDVIDSTTSEPLYAEIPFWRPPSEHAIEIMNLNGEAKISIKISVSVNSKQGTSWRALCDESVEMRLILLLLPILGIANTQYVKSAAYGVKGGYTGHGGQGHQYIAGDNLVRLFGNNTQSGYDTRTNLIASQEYEKNWCYTEVPTASLVRDPSMPVPAGNGSRSDLSRIRTCCKGYIKNIHNYQICEPYCSHDCVNALCTAPETCTCYPDHVKNVAGFCIPTCPIGCQNGRCAGGECICNVGYKLDSESKYCVPSCDDNCGGVGNCTAPNRCECKSAYQPTLDGSCKPICNGGCSNGDCVAPDECRCHQGYMKDVNRACVPKCAQDCGPNSRCISPNVCSPTAARIPGQLPNQPSNQSYPTNYPLYTSGQPNYRPPQQDNQQSYHSSQPSNQPVGYPYPNGQQSYYPTGSNTRSYYPHDSNNQTSYHQPNISNQPSRYPFNPINQPNYPSDFNNQPIYPFIPNNRPNNYPYNQTYNYFTSNPSNQSSSDLLIPYNQTSSYQPNQRNQPPSYQPNTSNYSNNPPNTSNHPSYRPIPSNQPSYYPYYPSSQPSLQPYDQTESLQVPRCSQPCINSVCMIGNRCSCNPGYVIDEEDPTGTRCKPHCPGGCHNGVCSAPNFCICNMGYYKDHSVKGRATCVKRIRRSADLDIYAKKPFNIADFLVSKI